MSYVALYKVFVAGDYHAVHISENGQAEYTEHSRTYGITARKQGNLSPGQATELFVQLRAKGFFELEKEYQLSSSGHLYEDVYYWISAFDGQRERTVLAHEYAAPTEMQEITQMLFDAVLQLPDKEEKGDFLLAVGYELVPYLRREEGMPQLELDPQSVTDYPPLETVLSNPGSLVQVESPGESRALRLFESKWHMMDVVYDDRQFVVLSLIQE